MGPIHLSKWFSAAWVHNADHHDSTNRTRQELQPSQRRDLHDITTSKQTIMSHLMSPKKLHGSWRAADDDHHKSHHLTETPKKSEKEEKRERNNPCPWSRQEMLSGRPDDYVGGYSPAWIHNYRNQQDRSKTIKIDGYNKNLPFK